MRGRGGDRRSRWRRWVVEEKIGGGGGEKIGGGECLGGGDGRMRRWEDEEEVGKYEEESV